MLINKKFFTTIIILYFSLFKYKFIYTILEKINLLNFIYPTILTFLLYFFFKHLIKNIKFLKFIIIFLTINLLLLSFDTAIKIAKIDYNKYQSSKTQLINIPFTSKKNIYYIKKNMSKLFLILKRL